MWDNTKVWQLRKTYTAFIIIIAYSVARLKTSPIYISSKPLFSPLIIRVDSFHSSLQTYFPTTMASNANSNENFEKILSQFDSSLDKVSEILSNLDDINYDELSTENKIRYDLFLAYSMNCLSWMYLRTVGEDPAQTIIKTEQNRVKDLLSELQFAIDRRTIMPRVDQAAAKRFTRNALFDPQNKPSTSKHTRFV